MKLRAVVTLGVLLALAGCTRTPPAQYYVLAAPAGETALAPRTGALVYNAAHDIAGPVLLALPEDMLFSEAAVADAPRYRAISGTGSVDEIKARAFEALAR